MVKKDIWRVGAILVDLVGDTDTSFKLFYGDNLKKLCSRTLITDNA